MKLLTLLLLIPLAACAPEPTIPPTCEQVKLTTGEPCPTDSIKELEGRLETLREVLEVQVRTLDAAVSREEKRYEIYTIIKHSHHDKYLAKQMLKAYSENIATLFEVITNIEQQIQEIDSYLLELKNVR
jgi:chaperonin cofactor prefoldin